MNIFRIAARLLGTMLALLVFVIFIGEGFNGGFPSQYPFTFMESVLFVCLLTGTVGLVVAWRREVLGGWLAIGGMLAFILIDSIEGGAFSVGWVFLSILSTGVLFLIAAKQNGAAQA